MKRKRSLTTRRIVRKHAPWTRKRRQHKTGTKPDHSTKFHALRVAQDILDHNRTLVVYGSTIGVVYPDGSEELYSREESKQIINEFHEMMHIAKRCTLLCDPLRKKLQELLFICQPIGLSRARENELLCR